MAKKVRIWYEKEAIRDTLLKSPEIAQFCEEVARQRLPDGCEIQTFSGANRINVAMVAVTKEARKDNLENNTLLKAVSR